jgi:hypothetical protein
MALGGPPRNHKNLAANAIFTPVRGIGILRTSPLRSSKKFASEFLRRLPGGPSLFIWSIGGAKEGRPHPLHIRQPTQRRTY